MLNEQFEMYTTEVRRSRGPSGPYSTATGVRDFSLKASIRDFLVSGARSVILSSQFISHVYLVREFVLWGTLRLICIFVFVPIHSIDQSRVLF